MIVNLDDLSVALSDAQAELLAEGLIRALASPGAVSMPRRPSPRCGPAASGSAAARAQPGGNSQGRLRIGSVRSGQSSH